MKLKSADLGEKLKYCRVVRAGMSQEELARKLYVDQAIISKVESGKMQPAYVLVREWAKVTSSVDVLGMDFSGNDGWKKLQVMEQVMKTIKSSLDMVNFMKVRRRKHGQVFQRPQGSAKR